MYMHAHVLALVRNMCVHIKTIKYLVSGQSLLLIEIRIVKALMYTYACTRTHTHTDYKL